MTGLSAISDDRGLLAVLAMDQRGTLRRMLTTAGRPAGDDDLVAFKIDVVSALAPAASGVLLDVEYAVPAVRAAGALPPGVGLLIAAEPAVKQTWQGEHRTVRDPERGAAWVREQTGDAVKFLVFWQPDRPVPDGGPDLAGEAVAVVREVVADCRRHGLPAVVEPLITFGPEGTTAPDEATRHAAVVRSATLLAAQRPDLLKLEWPGEAGCHEVTRALGPVPWALLSAGVGYDAFVDRVRVALGAGARGFIAGRAIWGEAAALPAEDRRAFLAEVARPRLDGLVSVLAEHGRPLTGATA